MEIIAKLECSRHQKNRFPFYRAALPCAAALTLCLALAALLGSPAVCPAAEVALAFDINPGPGSSAPGWMTELNGKLYFTAYMPATGVELYRFDGETVSLAADILTGPGSSTPASLAAYNNRLYFSASGASGPPRLYQFDGATASLTPGYTASQNPEALFVYDGKLYFRATMFGSYGTELWRYDGAGQRVIDLYPGPGSSGPKEFIRFNGQVYFNASSQFWRYDGTTPTLIDQDINPEAVVVFDGKLYFGMYESTHGNELWCYDGVNPATRVTDINPGPEFASPSGMTVYNGAIYFSADNGIDGFELWRYDGAAAEMLADINPTPYVPGIDPVHNSFPHNFAVYKGVLFFAADDGEHGHELWSYDGENLTMLADLYPGPGWSDPGEFTVFNDVLYFTASSDTLGSELWKVVPSLKLLSPNGGESLNSGSKQQITWKKEPCVQNVDIEFSADNGSTWATVTPPNSGNTGSYTWLVPNIESEQCLVRISDSDNPGIADQSDSAFEIFQCTLAHDLNGDCLVDMEDLSLLLTEWLKCGKPNDPTCGGRLAE